MTCDAIWFGTALGAVYVAATHRGVCRVTLPDPTTAVEPARQVASELLNRARSELTGYLAGRPVAFSFDLDLRGTAFQLAVWDAVRRIPFADTATYQQVAHAVGRPGAARAVGQAMAANPVPLVVPCHRVVASGGGLGGFGGGVQLKRLLLEMEAGQRLPRPGGQCV